MGVVDPVVRELHDATWRVGVGHVGHDRVDEVERRLHITVGTNDHISVFVGAERRSTRGE